MTTAWERTKTEKGGATSYQKLHWDYTRNLTTDKRQRRRCETSSRTSFAQKSSIASQSIPKYERKEPLTMCNC
eukprot:3381147-Amphidinium_carterae.1